MKIIIRPYDTDLISLDYEKTVEWPVIPHRGDLIKWELYEDGTHATGMVHQIYHDLTINEIDVHITGIELP